MTKVPFWITGKEATPRNNANKKTCGWRSRLQVIFKRLRNSTDAGHDKKKIAERGPLMAAKNMTENRFTWIPHVAWNADIKNGKARAAGKPSVTLTALRNRGTRNPHYYCHFETRDKKKNSLRNGKQYSQLRRITTEQPRSKTVHTKKSCSTKKKRKEVPGSPAPR